MSLCLALIIVGVLSPSRVRLEDITNEGVFRIYSTDVVYSPLIVSRTSVGFAFIYHVCPSNVQDVRKLFTRIDGESISFCSSKKCVDGVLRLFGARVISTSQIGNIESTLAKTRQNDRFIVADGQRVNLQIAVSGERTTVGWPLILGSF